MVALTKATSAPTSASLLLKPPVGVNEYKISSSEVVPVGGVISQTNHGYLTGQLVKLDEATGATLPSGWIDDAAYFVIKLSADTFALAATAADAVAGTQIDPADSGSDNPEGGCFLVSLDSNPYTYTYTEDEDSRPLSPVRDFAGENNFYCVPLSEGDQANAALTEVYGHGCLEIGNERITLYSSYTEIEFVEPQVEVPNGLWNFDAVTSADLIGEALRGVNNNGVPQAVVVEKGMDNHSRLFEESQNYSTTQGFLAYYAPHVLNDVGVYVPPTSFVTGLAMKRYRDDIAGFRLPPAGAKVRFGWCSRPSGRNHHRHAERFEPLWSERSSSAAWLQQHRSRHRHHLRSCLRLGCSYPHQPCEC